MKKAPKGPDFTCPNCKGRIMYRVIAAWYTGIIGRKGGEAKGNERPDMEIGGASWKKGQATRKKNKEKRRQGK